jgi:hypothetical protein
VAPGVKPAGALGHPGALIHPVAPHCLVRNRRGVGFTFSAEEARVLKGLISLCSSDSLQTLAKENSSTRFARCTNVRERAESALPPTTHRGMLHGKDEM